MMKSNAKASDSVTDVLCDVDILRTIYVWRAKFMALEEETDILHFVIFSIWGSARKKSVLHPQNYVCWVAAS